MCVAYHIATIIFILMFNMEYGFSKLITYIHLNAYDKNDPLLKKEMPK